MFKKTANNNATTETKEEKFTPKIVWEGSLKVKSAVYVARIVNTENGNVLECRGNKDSLGVESWCLITSMYKGD